MQFSQGQHSRLGRRVQYSQKEQKLDAFLSAIVGGVKDDVKCCYGVEESVRAKASASHLIERRREATGAEAETLQGAGWWRGTAAFC